MTSPIVTGQVAVEIVADARALAKSLRKETEAAFKGLDLRSAIRSAIGKTTIKVPIDLDPNTDSIGDKVRRTRVPKVPVELDPVLAAFQQEIRRQTSALARQVNVNIPVGADAGGLRTELGVALAAIKAQTRIVVPTEPGDRTEYEAKLKAQVAAVSSRVKAHIKAEVDVDKDGGVLGKVGSVLKGISNLLPDIGGFSSKIADLGGSLQKVTGTSAQLGGSLVGAFEAATGPVGIVIGLLVAAAGAVAAVATAAITAGPAIGVMVAGLSTLAGAAAAIPGALAGVGATIGTLALGFRGIKDAFKPKTGGGGGGGASLVNQARQIAAAARGVEAARRGIAAANRAVTSAERGYEQAQQRVVDAQKRVVQAELAIHRARVEAVEDIDDLNRSLRGARIGEKEAAQDLEDAVRALNEVELTGDLPGINRARNALDRAQLSLEEAKDTADDLGQAQQEQSVKGVEGSDKVQQALGDQADALRAVQDAQDGVLSAQNAVLSANDGLKSSYDGLTSAQESLAQAQEKTAASSGGLAAEVTKLAPSARKFVSAIKALKPAFESLRLDVQQRLFQGLDKTVTNLGKNWIKPLRETLGTYADTFNGFFRNLGASIGTPQFITDLQAGAEGARKGFAAIGESITTSLVPAFGTLARASAPFLEGLGKEIGKVVTKFSEWVQAGEKSGALQRFFATATKSMHDIFDIGSSVTSILGSLISIIIGRELGSTKKSPIEQLKDGLSKVSAWLKDPSNQEKVRVFLDDLTDSLAKIGKLVGNLTKLVAGLNKLKTAVTGVDSEGKKTGQVGGVLRRIAGLFSDSDSDKAKAEAAAHAAGSDIGTGVFAGADGAFKANMHRVAGWLYEGPNSLVGRIKSLLGIASPSTVMMAIGSDIVAGLIQGIGDRIGEVIGKVSEIPNKIREALGGAGSWLRTHGQQAVDGIRTGLSSKLGDLRTTAGTLKTTVTNRLSDAGSWLRTHGQSAASSLGEGISARLGTIRAVATNLKNTVLNALSGAGSWLYTHGQNTVIGLWNGIAYLGGWLYNKVANFIRDNIKNPVRDFLRIGSPSKLAAELGREVPAGLAIGIESNAGLVRDAAAVIAAAALPSIPDASLALGLESDAAITRSLTAASSATLQAQWAQGMTGDPILDGLRKMIEFKYRGSSNLALDSA